MTTADQPVRQALAAYQAAVLAKDVDAFVAIYADDVQIFELWGQWTHDLASWREMAKGWFTFLGDERDLSMFASRGQQRTAILAYKLAQLDLLTSVAGQPPLLLLDDVFSELDPDRRAHLVRRIGALPQAFVTTTTTDDLDPALVAASTVWQVSPGRLDRGAA